MENSNVMRDLHIMLGNTGGNRAERRAAKARIRGYIKKAKKVAAAKSCDPESLA